MLCSSSLGQGPSCTLLWGLRLIQRVSLCPHDASGMCHRPSEVKVAQSYPTPYDPMGSSPPVPSVHVILQARILQWVAMSSSRGSSQSRNQTWVSCIAGRLFTTCATREALPTPNLLFLTPWPPQPPGLCFHFLVSLSSFSQRRKYLQKKKIT